MRPRRASARPSLRGQLIRLVLVGAVLPMGLVGWWLTRTAVRSAEGRLSAQLDSSMDVIVHGIEQEWPLRKGELAMLADNEVVVRTMSSGVNRSTADDSVYMRRLITALAPSLLSAKYVMGDGAVRWELESDPATRRLAVGRGPEPVPPTILVRRSIARSTRTGDTSGPELQASVRLSSFLPGGGAASPPVGAVLSIFDRSREVALRGGPRSGSGWLEGTRRGNDPPLDLVLASQSDAYVKPFERAAALGLAALVAVAGAVVLVSIILATRITRALEELVDASDAVAAGDLERNVPVRGTKETSQLADAFNAMTKNLRTTLQELATTRSLATVGEFAAMLSHDVRNGLSAIRVDLQRIEEETPDTWSTRPLAARALENVTRLDASVSGSLRVARGAQRRNETVDLRRVIQCAAIDAQAAIQAAGASFDLLDCFDEPVLLKGDELALEQLFLNLLLNAAQAVAGGGRVALSISPRKDAVGVAITDNGVGMSADEITKAGIPFVTSKRAGTGLGLTIARRIAESHGGFVLMNSEPGAGTTVLVELPLLSAGASRDA